MAFQAPAPVTAYIIPLLLPKMSASRLAPSGPTLVAMSILLALTASIKSCIGGIIRAPLGPGKSYGGKLTYRRYQASEWYPHYCLMFPPPEERK